MEKKTPFMGIDRENGSRHDASLPTSTSSTTAEGGVDKTNRKSPKGSKNVKPSQLRTGSNVKGTHVQQPSVIQAWRNIFARPHSAKSKPASQSAAPKAKHEKHKKHEKRKDGEKYRDGEAILGPDPDSSVSTLSGTRLGKAELGRYAHEEAMPRSLRALLQGRGESCNSGIIAVLSKLLKTDPSTKFAYLCDARVQHVAKMSREGSFCGYRNLQMLISYIINAQAPGAQLFAETYPTIFQLQDLIENAWDLGHNQHGRLETGGIKGTRKFIGTPEAQALFSGLGIKCSTQAFRNEEQGRAATLLLDAAFDYFKQKSDQQLEQKVYRTKAAPIYFQHQGHSMTIVGVERKQDGGKALVVFDPAHRDASVVKALVGATGKRLPTTTSRLLRPYRCTFKYLSKYKEFELLFLDPSPTT